MSKRRHSTSSAESVIQIARGYKPSTLPEIKAQAKKKRKQGQQGTSNNRPTSPSAQLTYNTPSTDPVKRRPGRPPGSKNKVTMVRPADGDPASKRRRFGELIVVGGTSGESGTPNEATRVISLDQAVSNLGIIANGITSLSRMKPGAPKEDTNIFPETPRKTRRTTAHQSPHFDEAQQSPGTILDSSLYGLSTPSKKTTSSVSKHFSPRKGKGVSTIRFPLLKESKFGLIQEELASNPFHVLIAVIFLSKTTGTAAIPVIRTIAESYPTPEALAAVTAEDLFPDIQHLGFGSTRAQGIIDLAKAWIANPPEKGKRYKRLNYPKPGSGKDIQPRDEPLNDQDPRDAYEVAHLPGIGPYGIDSWRIFCRDDLRGVSSGIEKDTLKLKTSATLKELEQEWPKVQPQDKELRAYIKWRWLRLGVNWDPETDDKEDIDRDILKQMQKGRIDEHEGLMNPWKNAGEPQLKPGKLFGLTTPQ